MYIIRYKLCRADHSTWTGVLSLEHGGALDKWEQEPCPQSTNLYVAFSSSEVIIFLNL